MAELAALGEVDPTTGGPDASDHVEWSASVVKAMLIVSYLDEPWVRGRALTAGDNPSSAR